jgi:hypothetical protein
VLFISLQPLQDSVFDGNGEHFLWFVAGVGAWLGWSIPFLIVHRWLKRKAVIAPSSISQLADTQSV